MVIILPIIKDPQKILHEHAHDVPPDEIMTPHIQELILNMKETLKNTFDGVGLAAPQVDEPLRIFIISEEAEDFDLRDKNVSLPKEKIKESRDWKYLVFINPLVRNISKRKIEGPEGCLSVPGKFGLVKRHEKITVEAYDENGKKFIRGASKFFARVIQHELDHLKGALFIEKAKKITEVVRTNLHEE